MTRAELIALVTSNIYANNNNEVTAPMVRDSILAVIAFMGDAATYNVGAVEQGGTTLVTGGSVYSAINTALSAAVKFQGVTTTALYDGATTNPITIDGASYTARKGDEVIYGGKEFLWTGTKWQQLGDEESWALKTVTISAGTGLTGGGDLTANRTISLSQDSIDKLALAASAYQLPATGIPKTDLAAAVQTTLGNADTVAGYFNSGILGSTHLPSMYVGRTQVAFSAANATLLGIDAISNAASSGNTDKSRIVWDNTNKAWHFLGSIYADGFVSGGGMSSGGGSGGIDLDAMWASLTTNSDSHGTDKIAAGHIPDMSSTYGYLKSADLSAYATRTWVGENYVAKAGDTMTGDLSVPHLNITSTGGADELTFARGSYNYQRAKTSGGIIAFITDGKSMSGANIDMAIGNGWVSVNNAANGASGYNLYVNGTLNATTLYQNGSSLSSILGSYLPLTAGVDKPLTGDLYFPHDTGIRIADKDGNKWVVLKTSTVDSINYTTIGPAVGKTEIRSGYVDLYHYRGDTEYKIYTAQNSNKSDVAWTCSTLDANGKLQVIKNLNSTLAGAVIDADSAAGQRRAFLILDPTGPFGAGSDYIYIGAYQDGSARFDTPNGGTLTIASSLSVVNSGNVGIGTSSPSYKLHIVGASSGTYWTTRTDATNSRIYACHSDGHGLEIDTKASSSSYYALGIWSGQSTLGSGGNSIFYVRADGNVGIGTSSPAYKLHVVTTSSWAAIFNSENAGVILANNSGHGVEINSKINSSSYNLLNVRYNQTSLHSGGTTALLVRGDGNVGIGTATPGYKLDVSGVIRAVNSSGGVLIGYGGNQINGLNSSGAYANLHLNMQSSGNVTLVYGGGSVGIGKSSPTAKLDVSGIIQTDNNIYLFESLKFTRPSYCYVSATGSGAALSFNIGESGSANSKMLINNNGNVSIGYFGDGGSKLYVAGNIVATGAVTGGQASDACLKTNVASMTDNQALAMIMSLRPVTFTWNQKATELYDQYKGDDLGFIAQEVEGIPGLSKAIGTIFEDYKRLDPVKFIAPMVKVAQNHETRIQQLERELAQVKSENKILRDRLNMS